jgi:formylglycine-generating enzyme required for sulfatase activity
MKKYSPEPNGPIILIDWYRAALYCNWLSQQDGLPPDQWCYEEDGRGNVTKLKKNYLSLTGYRLLTGAEWEYACRAGARTSRYYGETEELLPKYAWYIKNSGERTWPVGRKKPNDLGLFDLHGNVYTWCQERYQAYPKAEDGEVFEDKEDIQYIKDSDTRVVRGGSCTYQASDVRSANRNWFVPATRYDSVGFRPARTFTAE